ncbi:MAG: lipid A biosynthesis lauroyl acyltransferase [Rickettsiaceae bacterium]
MKKLQHIFEYILFLILTNILRLLGIDRSAAVCSFVARRVGPYLKVTKTARKNLSKVYGTDIDSNKLIDDLWDNFGRYLGEFPFINALSSDELNQRVKITGLEHISHLQQQSQPFLLFLGHQANWDFVIRKINDIYPKFAIAYRKANNPYIDKEILQARKNDPNVTMIAKGPSGARDLVKALKTKSAIAMLIDQKMNDGIEVPFFNLPAMTAPAVAKLSIQYQYPIVPLQIVRIGRSSYFELIIHKPLHYDVSGNMDTDCYNIMLQINKTLEQWILEHPSQWFWFHNRWKN